MTIFSFFNKNIKKYGHIISLGYNCKVAYQFFLYHHFVESSLFAWSNTLNIDNLIYAIDNIDKILSEKVENVRPMWKCGNSNIRFHGKAPMNICLENTLPADDIIKKDKEDEKYLMNLTKF